MSYFILNLLFAIGWVVVNQVFTFINFVFGFFIGFISLWITQPLGKRSTYFKRLKAFAKLFFFLVFDLSASACRVAWEVLTPHITSRPEIIHYPLDAKSDIEITLLANMISLSPGSLTLDVSEDRSYLIIHEMFADNPNDVINSIKKNLEKNMLEVIRG